MTSLLHDEVPYFAQLAAVERDHWWSRGMWQIAYGYLAKKLRNRHGLHALDVGCGAGGTLRRLSALPQIERVTGIDPSPAALSLAADRDVSLASAQALPYEDCSFDLVTCFDVLQHLGPGDDARATHEIKRVLRPCGLAIIRTNGRGLWPDHSRSDVLYDLPSLRRIAREAGLEIIHASYANCLPSIATEVLGHVHCRFTSRAGSSRLGHPQGLGLRIRPVNKVLDRAMGLMTTIEAFAITQLNLSLPVGHSIVMLLRKPGGPNS